VRGVELRFYMAAAHYRSHVEFSFEALEEAAAGYRRIESFLERAAAALGEDVPLGTPCAEFVTAMDDDLGTPAAVGALFDVTREGNKLLAGNDLAALRGSAGSVRAMLDILGLDPGDPVWAASGASTDTEERLTAAVDVLVAGLLDERTQARADKDWARADAIRDRIKSAGIDVTDTPDGPTWTVN
jgi:cysteinyl-tRNA synthetase